MKRIKHTEEQKRIFKYIQKRKENLVIEARAGCGKTFTLVQASKLIPKEKSNGKENKIIFLAFNKHIKEELAEKLPSHVKCYTTYGAGLGALKRKYPSIEFDEFKIDHILKEKSKNWKLNIELPNAFDRDNYLSGLKKFINLCRLTLTMDKEWMKNIAERYEIPYDTPKDLKRVASVMEFLMNDRKKFDFTDMVFLPAIDNSIWFFPQDYVLVDEIQDLNRAQQKIIDKMIRKDKISKKPIGRFIGVGDNFQAIYGFTGVSNSTFDWFKKRKNTKVLPLTHTFRCGKNIVLEANKIVKDIKPLDDAPDGIVREGSVLDEPQSGDFVLCRTTTPLIKLFFRYLLEGKKAMIKGSDVGVSLIEMTTSYKTINPLVAYWTNEVEDFKIELKKKGILNYQEHSGFCALEDKVMTLNFLAKLSKDIPDLRDKIAKIFTDKISGIVLSTVHKAKGLEADRVFIARPDKLPLPTSKGWQYMQELNLKYVAVTRAAKELVFDYEWNDEEEE